MGFLDHGFQSSQCANERCIRHSERLGGKFELIDGNWYCAECAPFAGSRGTAKNLWEFATTHFNGESIHVTSLAHLRQLEKKYGVSNYAANYDQRNW